MSLAVLVATIALLPLLTPAGPGNTAPVDVLVGLFLFLSVLGLLHRRRPLRIPAGVAILLVLVGSVLALIASLDIATGLLTLVVDVYLFCLFIAVVNELDNRRALEIALTAWVVAALGWGLVLIGSNQGWLPAEAQTLLGVTADASERAAAGGGNPNLVASYMLTSFFVALAAPWPRRRLARLAVLALLLWAMYATGSNGALAAFLVGVAVLGLGVYLRGARTREQIMGLVGAATLAGVVLLGVLISVVGIPTLGVADVEALARSEQQGALANSIGRLDRGIDDRLRLWSSGWQGAAPRLVVGVGPGEAINYAVNLQGVPNSLHNDLLAYLVERGVLGLLGFLALHWALLGWSGRLLVTDGRGRDVFRGLAAAVVANLVFSMSHEMLHFRHVWVLYAMVWAAYVLAAERERSASLRRTSAAASIPA